MSDEIQERNEQCTVRIARSRESVVALCERQSSCPGNKRLWTFSRFSRRLWNDDEWSRKQFLRTRGVSSTALMSCFPCLELTELNRKAGFRTLKITKSKKVACSFLR